MISACILIMDKKVSTVGWVKTGLKGCHLCFPLSEAWQEIIEMTPSLIPRLPILALRKAPRFRQAGTRTENAKTALPLVKTGPFWQDKNHAAPGGNRVTTGKR
jgi:hypothetical protein